ncbi:TetR/AcrR family transcriptional regulator [Longimicrobium sp.]|uniref:TetR/AcrR family transcriptional regulator n=1 Tax=Longimicrobium sp. TaxID=2029185 RepID=UPI002E3091E6|nr:TetR/AcrR family transcriptional regulator [Longimicrobium sp.]HEX6041731.1 TetR/AcrR family transcriptional regulator [Longimicrobium sp.]
MSPRPRTTSDSTILDAVTRVISRVGPARMTLADVAGEAGHSPAGLVQRFGSKRGLLLAVARQRAGEVRGAFAMARAWQPSPLEAMFEVLAGFVAHADTPEALAHHLGFTQVELDDAEFHAAAFESARTMLGGIRVLLDQAVEAGELAACDAESVARTVQTTYNGALVTWAVYRQGTLGDWLRGEIEAVLEPWLPPLGTDGEPDEAE